MAIGLRKERHHRSRRQRLTLGVCIALGIAFGTALKSVLWGILIGLVLWHSSKNRNH